MNLKITRVWTLTTEMHSRAVCSSYGIAIPKWASTPQMPVQLIRLRSKVQLKWQQYPSTAEIMTEIMSSGLLDCERWWSWLYQCCSHEQQVNGRHHPIATAVMGTTQWGRRSMSYSSTTLPCTWSMHYTHCCLSERPQVGRRHAASTPPRAMHIMCVKCTRVARPRRPAGVTAITEVLLREAGPAATTAFAHNVTHFELTAQRHSARTSQSQQLRHRCPCLFGDLARLLVLLLLVVETRT